MVFSSEFIVFSFFVGEIAGQEKTPVKSKSKNAQAPMSSIIQVRDLSKSYMISHEGRERYTALRDVVSNKAKKIFSFAKSSPLVTKEEFWALKDISFDIAQGDRIGIIGRNGAGKSTLLKILSRIVDPTAGTVKIKGRVASLLEVGTGFHPELTGRENIFLNGAILGMSRSEIRKHFDAIVDFAEIEKFLDTPVKRYSSGMYVRLAFAVAAHLEPEILVVDEVLAVGDAQFQKKCLGKMEDVSKGQGRTVLFVSHNTGALMSLCNKGIVLKNGNKVHDGDIVSAISYYNDSGLKENVILSKKVSDNLVIEGVVIEQKDVWSLEEMAIAIKLDALKHDETIKTLAVIISKAGKRMGVVDLRVQLTGKLIRPGSSFGCEVKIHHLPLIEGDYDVSLYLETSTASGDFNDLARFSVFPKKKEQQEHAPYDVSVRGDIEFDFSSRVL
jgi:lipopolysaccharide transport system ATP-binding protein